MSARSPFIDVFIDFEADCASDVDRTRYIMAIITAGRIQQAASSRGTRGEKDMEQYKEW
jgi:hypothetical protein